MISLHRVKCFYCGKSFDRDKIPYFAVRSNRYAHLECHEQIIAETEKEKQEKEELEEYIRALFNYDKLPERVNKQIGQFHLENKYSYSAIKKTLIYFFEIKKNTLEKANGGIGIVPYVIDEAKNYWAAIVKAQNFNKKVDAKDYILPTREVHIFSPPRESMKHLRKQFTFLEEEIN